MYDVRCTAAMSREHSYGVGGGDEASLSSDPDLDSDSRDCIVMYSSH
jgi:hypothetical protein